MHVFLADCCYVLLTFFPKSLDFYSLHRSRCTAKIRFEQVENQKKIAHSLPLHKQYKMLRRIESGFVSTCQATSAASATTTNYHYQDYCYLLLLPLITTTTTNYHYHCYLLAAWSAHSASPSKMAQKIQKSQNWTALKVDSTGLNIVNMVRPCAPLIEDVTHGINRSPITKQGVAHAGMHGP